MDIKRVDTNEYKLDPFARPKDEVFEYNRRNPIDEDKRGNHNTLFLKRSFWSYDIHVREMLGYLIAKECGIPACETELAIYPMLHGHFEKAVISYSEVSIDDKIILPINLVNEYRRKIGLKPNHDWLLDVESILNSVFGLMTEKRRPKEEYDKFLQDFITMMIYDIKFVNSDRDNKNWYIRINNRTGEIDLYPLFDNASIFASERDPIPNITDEQARDLSEGHPLLILTPQDYREGKLETKSCDMLEYLLRVYPNQTSKALDIVDKIDAQKLGELIDSIPDVDENRKKQMIKVFEQRDKRVWEIYRNVLNIDKYRS